MSAGVELVPLECIRCGTPIPAEPNEVAWICGACGQGQRLTDDGVVAHTVHFAAGPASAPRRPFWVASAQVRFARRESYGKDSPPEARWSAPVRFILPAFQTSVEQAVELGVRLLESPPDLEEGEASTIAGVTLPPEEIEALARFVVLSVEADRRDKLEVVEFGLELDPPELWSIPRDV